jgi:hypothetical protein
MLYIKVNNQDAAVTDLSLFSADDLAWRRFMVWQQHGLKAGSYQCLLLHPTIVECWVDGAGQKVEVHRLTPEQEAQLRTGQ